MLIDLKVIHGKPGEVRRVRAKRINAVFCLHKSLDDRKIWRLTHIPTTYFAWQDLDPDILIAIAQILVDIPSIDWTRDDPDYLNAHRNTVNKAVKNLLHIIQRLKGTDHDA